MSSIDQLNGSLYFNAASEAAKAAIKKEKDELKTKNVKKFTDLLTTAREDIQADYDIPEIKGMSIEEAKQVLIDAVYSEGELLKQKPVQESFVRYKKAVSNFLKFVEKQCYEVDEIKGTPLRKGKGVFKVTKQKSYTLIKTVDEKLESLASDILFNQRDQLRLVAKVCEISGLLVDILS